MRCLFSFLFFILWLCHYLLEGFLLFMVLLVVSLWFSRHIFFYWVALLVALGYNFAIFFWLLDFLFLCFPFSLLHSLFIGRWTTRFFCWLLLLHEMLLFGFFFSSLLCCFFYFPLILYYSLEKVSIGFCSSWSSSLELCTF